MLRSRTWLRNDEQQHHFIDQEDDEEQCRPWRKRLYMVVTWRSLFRLLFTIILIGILTSIFLSLPMEKMLKDFLVWIDTSLGNWGPIVLAVAYIPLTVLAVPASILTMGGGYLFGLTIGFIADSIGSTAGATAAFFIGKTIGRSFVISRLKDYPQFQAVSIAIQRSGFKIVLLLRLVPLLPFNMLNYLLSVTPVSLGEYILGSWIGMMPITFAFVYVGTTIKDLSDVTHGWGEVSKTRGVLLASGFVASVLLMIVITKLARKTLKKALEENDERENDMFVPADLLAAKGSQTGMKYPLIIKIDPMISNHKN